MARRACTWPKVRVPSRGGACSLRSTPREISVGKKKFPPRHGNFRTPTEISRRRRGAARAARRRRPRLGARPACSREAVHGVGKKNFFPPPRKFPNPHGNFRAAARRGQSCEEAAAPASGHVLCAPARPADASGNSPEIWKNFNLNYSDHGELAAALAVKFPLSRISPARLLESDQPRAPRRVAPRHA